MLLFIDMKTNKYLVGTVDGEGSIIRLAEQFETDMIREDDSLERIFTVENLGLLHNLMVTYRKGVLIFPKLEFAIYFNETAVTYGLNEKFKHIDIHNESMYGIDIETKINVIIINKPSDLLESPVYRRSFIKLAEEDIVCDSANIIRAGLFLNSVTKEEVTFERYPDLNHPPIFSEEALRMDSENIDDVDESEDLKISMETFRDTFKLPIKVEGKEHLASHPRELEDEVHVSKLTSNNGSKGIIVKVIRYPQL